MTHSWGRGQGHHQQVLLACSTGKSCSLVPRKWRWSWGTGTGPAETNPEGRPGIRKPGSVLGLYCSGKNPNALVPLSPSVKCSRLETP